MKDSIMNQEREAVARLQRFCDAEALAEVYGEYVSPLGAMRADIRDILALRSGGEGWRPIEEAEDRFVLAAIEHGGTMVTVRAERIRRGGYHDTREGSSVGWRPGRNQRGFFKPWPRFEDAPSPSTQGEG